MTLVDEEDYLEFLEKRGFTNYYDPDDSTIIFKVTPRGKSKNLEIANEEIEALHRIGRIIHITAAIGPEVEEKDKPYINIEVVREKELDLRQPIKETQEKKEGEHPEHISDQEKAKVSNAAVASITTRQ